LNEFSFSRKNRGASKFYQMVQTSALGSSSSLFLQKVCLLGGPWSNVG